MCWEWNWPHRVSGERRWYDWIDLDVRLMSAGEDHGPGFYVVFQIGGLALLDFGYYNSHHADEQI
jgi:hypothetical protein